MSSLLVFNRAYTVDWRYSQSCWYFRTLLWTSAPLNLLTGSPLPPFPVWISTGTVCNRKGGSGCVESIYKSYSLCIWTDSEPRKLLPSPPGGLRQIHTCRQVPLQVIFLKKSRHLGFGVFKVIFSMLTGRKWWALIPYRVSTYFLFYFGIFIERR